MASWSERQVEHSKDVKFPPDKAFARVEKLGDLFEPVEKLKQKLPKCVETYSGAAKVRRIYEELIKEYTVQPEVCERDLLALL